MRISKQQLNKIIQEELQNLLEQGEEDEDIDWDDDDVGPLGPVDRSSDRTPAQKARTAATARAERELPPIERADVGGPDPALDTPSSDSTSWPASWAEMSAPGSGHLGRGEIKTDEWFESASDLPSAEPDSRIPASSSGKSAGDYGAEMKDTAKLARQGARKQKKADRKQWKADRKAHRQDVRARRQQRRDAEAVGDYGADVSDFGREESKQHLKALVLQELEQVMQEEERKVIDLGKLETTPIKKKRRLIRPKKRRPSGVPSPPSAEGGTLEVGPLKRRKKGKLKKRKPEPLPPMEFDDDLSIGEQRQYLKVVVLRELYNMRFNEQRGIGPGPTPTPPKIGEEGAETIPPQKTGPVVGGGPAVPTMPPPPAPPAGIEVEKGDIDKELRDLTKNIPATVPENKELDRWSTLAGLSEGPLSRGGYSRRPRTSGDIEAPPPPPPAENGGGFAPDEYEEEYDEDIGAGGDDDAPDPDEYENGGGFAPEVTPEEIEKQEAFDSYMDQLLRQLEIDAELEAWKDVFPLPHERDPSDPWYLPPAGGDRLDEKEDTSFSDAGKEIEKKGTEGVFTAKADKAGMGVQAYADKVLAKDSKASTKTKRQAAFAKGAATVARENK